MSSNYLLSIETVSVVDGEKDFSLKEYSCSFSGDKDDCILKYEEETEDGAATTTMHYIKRKGLSIKRESEMQSFLIVEKNKRHLSHLRTPYGVFEIGVTGTELLCEIEEQSGKLFFDYTTDTNGSPLGVMSFKLRFYKKGTEKPEDFRL